MPDRELAGVHAVAAAGDAVEDGRRRRDRQRSDRGHHGEVEPADPQRRHPDGQPDEQRQDDCGDDGDEGVPVVLRGEHPADVGADRERRRRAERDLPGEAEHDVDPDHGEGVKGRGADQMDGADLPAERRPGEQDGGGRKAQHGVEQEAAAGRDLLAWPLVRGGWPPPPSHRPDRSGGRGGRGAAR